MAEAGCASWCFHSLSLFSQVVEFVEMAFTVLQELRAGDGGGGAGLPDACLGGEKAGRGRRVWG